MDTNLDKLKISALEIREVGYVRDLRQGIAKIAGLPSCVYGQMVLFSKGTKGIVMGFNPQEVLVIILGDETSVSVGDSVSSLAELLTVPVGDNFLGRVVNSLAEPLDGKGAIGGSDFFPVFREAPGVMEREPITEPLPTGIKMIDLVLPIGKGQRELIIGDRQTGKSSIGIDAIINQKDNDMICIYCWIGGPQAALKKILYTLHDKGALKYSIIVSSSADTSAAEQYLVPYTAAALGEYFMYNGRHVLVIFDDLTKHAWIYRQMSLLLERSPGREAYPGDIFYLHSQLLERAGRLKKERKGGSMTFLPIVETMQGDITGYIQTNVISITDGQIYISAPLFREGFKPAIDLGLSVSRIGSRVQCPAIKEVSLGLRLEYAQYREMLRLTKLRTHLSAEATERLHRGETLYELLMQPNTSPLSVEEQICLFYAFKRKILEALPPPELKKFIQGFFEYLTMENPHLIELLKERKEITGDIKDDLEKTYTSFFKMLKHENGESSE
ncbi:MAG: F0F1 ATP synthase subunit alpha [Candidatus Omnitrophica bacterium]|nr:F0F1 ATP synthase subunit alpha [Candidatus Omnitrophota bacterium]